jgi:2-methylcitrate dehydratase
VDIGSHRYALAILDKTGPLRNFAERDHCMQYIAAIGMIFGRLESTDYEEAVAADPRIDALRRKIVLHEHAPYTRGFFDPARRSNANAMQVTFRDGSRTARIEVEYAVGHPRRRKEGLPLLERKFENNVARVYAGTQRRRIMALCGDRRRLAETPVNEFCDLLAMPLAG